MKSPSRPINLHHLTIALLILFGALVDRNQCAPAVEDEDVEGGCYYMFNHYGEGDRILTNEPCLNCTCHNSMLMCYLRVCPFTKPIGQDCTIEKKPDQCCPVITCPQVPVSLVTPSAMVTTTSTTTAATVPSSEVALHERGCEMDGKYYADGAQVASDHNKPCELCYCIRNRTACVMQECILHVEGCKPIFEPGVCCPVRYQCDAPLEIETTTQGLGNLISTTISSIIGAVSSTPQPGGCIRDGEYYADGSQIPNPEEDPCNHCYCMRGDIVCAVQECGSPLENEGGNCTAIPPRAGLCCPEKYACHGSRQDRKFNLHKNETDMGQQQEDETTSQTTESIAVTVPELVSTEGIEQTTVQALVSEKPSEQPSSSSASSLPSSTSTTEEIRTTTESGENIIGEATTVHVHVSLPDETAPQTTFPSLADDHQDNTSQAPENLGATSTGTIGGHSSTETSTHAGTESSGVSSETIMPDNVHQQASTGLPESLVSSSSAHPSENEIEATSSPVPVSHDQLEEKVGNASAVSAVPIITTQSPEVNTSVSSTQGTFTEMVLTTTAGPSQGQHHDEPETEQTTTAEAISSPSTVSPVGSSKAPETTVELAGSTPSLSNENEVPTTLTPGVHIEVTQEPTSETHSPSKDQGEEIPHTTESQTSQKVSETSEGTETEIQMTESPSDDDIQTTVASLVSSSTAASPPSSTTEAATTVSHEGTTESVIGESTERLPSASAMTSLAPSSTENIVASSTEASTEKESSEQNETTVSASKPESPARETTSSSQVDENVGTTPVLDIIEEETTSAPAGNASSETPASATTARLPSTEVAATTEGLPVTHVTGAASEKPSHDESLPEVTTTVPVSTEVPESETHVPSADEVATTSLPQESSSVHQGEPPKHVTDSPATDMPKETTSVEIEVTTVAPEHIQEESATSSPSLSHETASPATVESAASSIATERIIPTTLSPASEEPETTASSSENGSSESSDVPTSAPSASSTSAAPAQGASEVPGTTTEPISRDTESPVPATELPPSKPSESSPVGTSETLAPGTSELPPATTSAASSEVTEQPTSESKPPVTELPSHDDSEVSHETELPIATTTQPELSSKSPGNGTSEAVPVETTVSSIHLTSEQPPAVSTQASGTSEPPQEETTQQSAHASSKQPPAETTQSSAHETSELPPATTSGPSHDASESAETTQSAQVVSESSIASSSPAEVQATTSGFIFEETTLSPEEQNEPTTILPPGATISDRIQGSSNTSTSKSPFIVATTEGHMVIIPEQSDNQQAIPVMQLQKENQTTVQPTTGAPQSTQSSSTSSVSSTTVVQEQSSSVSPVSSNTAAQQESSSTASPVSSTTIHEQQPSVAPVGPVEQVTSETSTVNSAESIHPSSSTDASEKVDHGVTEAPVGSTQSISSSSTVIPSSEARPESSSVAPSVPIDNSSSESSTGSVNTTPSIQHDETENAISGEIAKETTSHEEKLTTEKMQPTAEVTTQKIAESEAPTEGPQTSVEPAHEDEPQTTTISLEPQETTVPPADHSLSTEASSTEVSGTTVAASEEPATSHTPNDLVAVSSESTSTTVPSGTTESISHETSSSATSETTLPTDTVETTTGSEQEDLSASQSSTSSASISSTSGPTSEESEVTTESDNKLSSETTTSKSVETSSESQPSNENNVESSSPAFDDSTEPAEIFTTTIRNIGNDVGSTSSSEEKDTSSATTESEEAPVSQVPTRIPGEGSCFVEGITYRNGSRIPPSTPCQIACACQNSIVHCLLRHCPPPASDGCKPVYTSGICCPEYNCETSTGSPSVTVTPEPSNQENTTPADVIVVTSQSVTSSHGNGTTEAAQNASNVSVSSTPTTEESTQNGSTVVSSERPSESSTGATSSSTEQTQTSESHVAADHPEDSHTETTTSSHDITSKPGVTQTPGVSNLESQKPQTTDEVVATTPETMVSQPHTVTSVDSQTEISLVSSSSSSSVSSVSSSSGPANGTSASSPQSQPPIAAGNSTSSPTADNRFGTGQTTFPDSTSSSAATNENYVSSSTPSAGTTIENEVFPSTINASNDSNVTAGSKYPVTTTTSVTPSPAPWPYPTSSTTQPAMSSGACLFDGKVYMSAQQIPRDDPCDFCFCFRGDIICLQQSCPPPIPGCYEEPIPGFCCPRYECPVGTGNSTASPPLFPPSYYHGQVLGNGGDSDKGVAPPNMIPGPGCEIQGDYYETGQVIVATSGPCLECRCGSKGMMECDPRECQPEPMLRKMIAAISSR